MAAHPAPSNGAPRWRQAWAEVDLDALRSNAGALAAVAAPAQLCAVVKADGYGHGAVGSARAAIAGGASWLAVALVEEGELLRAAGITVPVLLLSQPPPAALQGVVAAQLTPTLYTFEGIEAAAKAVAAAGPALAVRLPVHLKVDTGMHRVGAPVDEIVSLARAVGARPELRLEGLWTHFAAADEPGPFTARQIERFDEARRRLEAAGVSPPILHAANSAGTAGFPEAHLGLVRCGINLYGAAAAPGQPAPEGLRPAMALKARVSFVKEVEAGEGVSYGLRWQAPERTVVATVPLGYADGVRRALGAAGAEVLIGGRRRRIAGTVTMDQITVDCGPRSPVQAGDEVVLLGRQGDEEIRVEEWADLLGTITYEVLCGIGPRVPRTYLGGGSR